MKDKLLSIVVPLYNEEGNVVPFVKDLTAYLSRYSRKEIIFVDDGSCDNTLEKLRDISEKYTYISYISLSRNFGHQAALKAGLDHAKGDCVISMDGDFQHPISNIGDLIREWDNGYQIVYTKRLEVDGVSLFKRMTSKYFYKALNFISDVEIEPGIADFRLLDKKVVTIIRNMKEVDLFFRGYVKWVGYKSKAIEYTPENRRWGQSQYTLKKMANLAIAGITSFSTKPLTYSIFIGFFISLFAFIYGGYALYIKIFTNEANSGWTSLIASILFIGGIQLIILGIIGVYVGRIFNQVKYREIYLVDEMRKSDV